MLAASIAGISSPEFYLIGAAILFAGISKGGFGGSAGFLASAILAIFLDPAAAIGVMLPLLLVMDAATVKSFWRQWDKTRLMFLVLSSLIGLALGAWVFHQIDDSALRVLIGALSVLFVIWHLWPKPDHGQTQMPRGLNIGLGILTGFTAFVAHAGGPTAAIYLLGQRLPKTAYHATVSATFLIQNSIKAIPYAVLGICTLETLKLSAIYVPVALVGVWIGIKAHKIVSERAFFALTYALLLCAGLKLLYDGLL